MLIMFYSTPLMIFTSFLFLLYNCNKTVYSKTYFPEPSWWKLIQGVKKDNQILSPISRSKLTSVQQNMISRQPAVLSVVIDALQAASRECRLQFKNRQWNCTFQIDPTQPVFGPVSQRGCRETAFLYAITSAALTEAVAKACSQHKLKFCSCDANFVGPSRHDWEWSGCSDNIRYAIRFMKKFVSSAEKGADIRIMMNKHNNEAGGRFVMTLAKPKCTCHGLSASCSTKTCWNAAPNLHHVGEKLYAQFQSAVKVTPHNFQNNQFRRKRTRSYTVDPPDTDVNPVRKRDLIYFEETPNLCSERPEWIRNRRCNKHSLLTDGCDLMCCNGKYQTIKEKSWQKCNCTLNYCCEVSCKTCLNDIETHYCL